MTRLYYTAPTEEIFTEVKWAVIGLWNAIGGEGGYKEEKVEQILKMKNIEDNMMTIVAGFDRRNIARLLLSLTPGARGAVVDRMVDGANGGE
jgi:hypothetical protein